MLYPNAQNKFMLMNKLPFFNNLIKAKILNKFSSRTTTSAAFIFNYDFALILTPIADY